MFHVLTIDTFAILSKELFQLIDLPEAEIKDALVVKVKGENEVICFVFVFILLYLITVFWNTELK